MKWTKFRIALVAFLALSLVSGAMTGFTGSDDTDTPTPTPTTTPEPTQQSLAEALNASVTNSNAQSVDNTEIETDTETSFVEMRFSIGTLTGIGAEQEAAMPVKQALIVLNERGAHERVDEYRFFVTAETDDGSEATLTKVVIDAGVVSETNWAQTPWQQIRDDAEQYKFNG